MWWSWLRRPREAGGCIDRGMGEVMQGLFGRGQASCFRPA
jgi:hypothetical protein